MNRIFFSFSLVTIMHHTTSFLDARLQAGHCPNFGIFGHLLVSWHKIWNFCCCCCCRRCCRASVVVVAVLLLLFLFLTVIHGRLRQSPVPCRYLLFRWVTATILGVLAPSIGVIAQDLEFFFSLLSSLLLGFCCCCRCFVVVIFVLDRR